MIDLHFPLSQESRSAMVDEEYAAMRDVYMSGDDRPAALEDLYERRSLILNRNLARGNNMFRHASQELFNSRAAIDTSAYTYKQLARALNQDDNDDWFRMVLGTRLWMQFLDLSQSFYDLSLEAYLVARGRLYSKHDTKPLFVRFRAGNILEEAPEDRLDELSEILYRGPMSRSWQQVDWNDWPSSLDLEMTGGDGKFDEGTPVADYFRGFISIHPRSELKMREPLPWYVEFPRMTTGDLSLELMDMRTEQEWGLLDNGAVFEALLREDNFGLPDPGH